MPWWIEHLKVQKSRTVDKLSIILAKSTIPKADPPRLDFQSLPFLDATQLSGSPLPPLRPVMSDPKDLEPEIQIKHNRDRSCIADSNPDC